MITEVDIPILVQAAWVEAVEKELSIEEDAKNIKF